MSAYTERFLADPNNNVQILKRMLTNQKSERIRKLLALISLARMASSASIEVLEEYSEQADVSMKIYVKSALDEAREINRTTDIRLTTDH